MSDSIYSQSFNFGHYEHRVSIIHKFSPSAKYLWLIGIIIVSSISMNILSIGIIGLLTIISAIIANIKIRSVIKSFKPVLPIFIITIILQVLVSWPNDNSKVIFSILSFSLTVKELISIGMLALRFFIVMLSIILFTSVSTENDVVCGIEELLKPFSKTGKTAKSISMAISIVFRFIPIVSQELEIVATAQAARGANFILKSKNPFKKAKAYLPLLIPVIVRSLEKAENLATAMDARCFGENNPTHYNEVSNSKYNIINCVVAVFVTVLCLCLPKI